MYFNLTSKSTLLEKGKRIFLSTLRDCGLFLKNLRGSLTKTPAKRYLLIRALGFGSYGRDSLGGGKRAAGRLELSLLAAARHCWEAKLAGVLSLDDLGHLSTN